MPPVWPWQAVKLGRMLDFDLIADDLDEAAKYAITCGARLAEEKLFDDSRTLFDPVGRPFCTNTFHA